MKNLFAFLLLLFSYFGAMAQEKGFLRGNLADGQFGGPLIGATVTVVERSGVGTTSDFDGNYSLPLEPGNYTVQISYISFVTQKFPNVVITAGAVTKVDATMEMATEQLAMVEVVAEVKKSSEAGVLMEMKNATTVTDGLSAQSFRKIGDSDLSGAIKRVTGVTIQDGKYVYVRGLGDRYTKTLLNGMAIPGLDPDANAVQIDIFPTSVLENVSVFKTFSPELDGDFAGGLVNVITKRFPEQKTTQLQVSLTYIPGQHFNNDFILYNQGNLDWLGFDDGSRALPIAEGTKVPDETRIDPILEEQTRSFNPQLAVKNKIAGPNGSFSFNHGNQINKENGATFGYNMVLNYTNERVFYKDFESNEFLRSTDKSENELTTRVLRIGDVGKNNVMWSSLLTGSYKKGANNFTATFLYNQSAETAASKRVNQDFVQNQSRLIEDVLTFSQRTLGTFILSGSHKLKKAEISWGNAFSYSRVYDPDFRETRISVTEGDTALSTGNGAGIDRFWRELTEFNESFKFDVKVPVRKNIDIKTGAITTLKFREFSVQSFKHRPNNLNEISIDPDWFLQDENIWSSDPSNPNYRDGTYTVGNFQPANSYDAQQYLFGAYVMSEHSILQKLNIIYGVRVEYVNMFYTGQNNSGSERYIKTKTLDNVNALPALNIVYKVTPKMNLRAGYSRTVARPPFKEKSIAQIYDPITKRTFVGNLDLKQTDIDNADLRYEFFMGGKDMISLSGFYKHFSGHIELVSFELAPDNLRPRNSGEAHVFGGEFEIRKGLQDVTSSKFLKGFFFGANVSVIHSMVDMKSVVVDDAGKNEFTLRQEFLRNGQPLEQFRVMSGQSPYAVNASISYEIQETGTNISLAYNVQGPQLSVIGSGIVPDVYTMSFHSLNFNAYHSFGKKRNSRLALGVDNILNDDRLLVYRSFEAEDEVFTRFKPGMAISIRYTYTF